MKKLILYFLLLMAVPATAQSGLFGSHPHHGSRGTIVKHHPGPLIQPRHPIHPAPHHEEVGMNPRDFDDAVRVISDENFDEKRLSIAKRIITDNPMSTRQIVGICKLFTFESNRLEFAKYAYPHCVDANNYFLVDEVFTFKSSKEELYNFIRDW